MNEKTIKTIKPYWPLLVGIILLTSFIASAFQTDETVTLPEKIAGEWISDSPKYADRYFALDERLLTFATAKDDFEIFLITDVQINEDNRGDSYILTYRDGQGIKYKFAFHYFPDEGDGGAIRIRNKNEIVWVKKKNRQEGNS